MRNIFNSKMNHPHTSFYIYYKYVKITKRIPGVEWRTIKIAENIFPLI